MSDFHEWHEQAFRKIQFEFPIEPVPKGRPRFTRFGKPYTPADTAAFERIIANMSRDQFKGREVMSGPLNVSIEFSFIKPKTVRRILHTVKPDLDNLIKAVTDSMNKIVWNDDAQISKIEATKQYALDGKPMIRVLVESAL